jgi:hypothetical protein
MTISPYLLSLNGLMLATAHLIAAVALATPNGPTTAVVVVRENDARAQKAAGVLVDRPPPGVRFMWTDRQGLMNGSKQAALCPVYSGVDKVHGTARLGDEYRAIEAQRMQAESHHSVQEAEDALSHARFLPAEKAELRNQCIASTERTWLSLTRANKALFNRRSTIDDFIFRQGLNTPFEAGELTNRQDELRRNPEVTLALVHAPADLRISIDGGPFDRGRTVSDGQVVLALVPGVHELIALVEGNDGPLTGLVHAIAIERTDRTLPLDLPFAAESHVTLTPDGWYARHNQPWGNEEAAVVTKATGASSAWLLASDEAQAIAITVCAHDRCRTQHLDGDFTAENLAAKGLLALGDTEQPLTIATTVQPMPIAPATVTSERPIYKRWWFWTTMSVLAVGGATAAIVLGGHDNGQRSLSTTFAIQP